MLPEARISAAYFIIALIWIFFSDTLLITMFNVDARTLSSLQTFKGIFFISATSAFFYILLRREFRSKRQDQAVIEQSRESFRYLFLHNPLPMWVYDPEILAFLSVNDTAIARYGYSREEFLGMTLKDIRPPEEVKRLLENVRQERSALQFSGEWKHWLKDGTIITVEIISHRLDFEGRPGVLVIAQDVTERKRLESELEDKRDLHQKLQTENEMRALRNRFVSMISHEFRNPLATITMTNSILQRYYDRLEADRKREHFETVEREVRRLQDMTDDLLAFMHSEFTGQEFHAEPVDLFALCEDVVEETQHNAGTTREIIFHAECREILIPADPKLMRYALINLLSNAVKYSPDGSRVWLRLACEADQVFVSVKDEGIGIPQAYLPQLFDPFYRAPNVGRIPGNGLGLAIVKQAIDLHGGNLKVSSQVNEGSEFTIELKIS